jgi:Ca-activated chloride channel family protein
MKHRFEAMRWLVLFVCSFFSPLGGMQAQIVVEPGSVDYGRIDGPKDRVVDLVFTNEGAKDALVLTTTVLPEYSYRWSAKTVSPDSSIVLRIKFNPQQKGKYNDEVSVFFSTMMKPVVVKFKAEVNYIDRRDSPACPSFNDRPTDCCNDAFTVEVVDAVSGQPLRDARVRIYEQGVKQRDIRTDRSGRYSEAIPIGYYLVAASADGYSSADSTGYINRRNNFLQLRLNPLPEPEVVADAIDQGGGPTDARPEAPKPLIHPHNKTEPEQANEEVITVITGGVPEPVQPVEAVYVPSNLVFLVDVSQSMFYKSRLELLKTGLVELIDALEDVDRMALISYAETTDEVIGLTAGDGKAELTGAVAGLTAGGRTKGAKGFRHAYGMLELYGKAGANNRLVVVTDGAFTTMDAQNIVELAAEYSAKGIATTIVGVRCLEGGCEKLALIAEACGSQLVILDALDAGGETLLREVAGRR